MKLKTNEFKKICSTALFALEPSSAQKTASVLVLDTSNNQLNLSIAGTDYYLSVKIIPDEFTQIRASVQAALFLKLISDIDSDEIELLDKDNYLLIKSSTGNFKLPYIFVNDKQAEVKKITINDKDKHTTMIIDGDILYSILQFNNKELVKTIWQKQELQKLFYIDQQGCITFTNGACINNFMLEKPVRFLLTPKIVKLFKLFKGEKVLFTLGYDELTKDLIQTKVSFETANTTLTAITLLNESVLLAKAGEEQIRGMGNKLYPYTVILDVETFKKAINRLLLFVRKEDQLVSQINVTCNKDSITLLGKGENTETITVGAGSIIDGVYKMRVQLYDLKLILDTCAEPTITMSFGDGRVIVFTRGNIKNLIPQARDL